MKHRISSASPPLCLTRTLDDSFRFGLALAECQTAGLIQVHTYRAAEQFSTPRSRGPTALGTSQTCFLALWLISYIRYPSQHAEDYILFSQVFKFPQEERYKSEDPNLLWYVSAFNTSLVLSLAGRYRRTCSALPPGHPCSQSHNMAPVLRQ